ncbi:hypothetical protein GCM10028777_38060 [Angustibacter speluncae]
MAEVQLVIYWGFALAFLALQVFALVDAGRHRADAYPATSNQSKRFWLIVLGVAVLAGVLSLPVIGGVGIFLGPFNILNIVAVVAAGIYLARVRPAVRAITGRSSGGW